MDRQPQELLDNTVTALVIPDHKTSRVDLCLREYDKDFTQFCLTLGDCFPSQCLDADAWVGLQFLPNLKNVVLNLSLEELFQTIQYSTKSGCFKTVETLVKRGDDPYCANHFHWLCKTFPALEKLTLICVVLRNGHRLVPNSVKTLSIDLKVGHEESLLLHDAAPLSAVCGKPSTLENLWWNGSPRSLTCGDGFQQFSSLTNLNLMNYRDDYRDVNDHSWIEKNTARDFSFALFDAVRHCSQTLKRVAVQYLYVTGQQIAQTPGAPNVSCVEFHKVFLADETVQFSRAIMKLFPTVQHLVVTTCVRFVNESLGDLFNYLDAIPFIRLKYVFFEDVSRLGSVWDDCAFSNVLLADKSSKEIALTLFAMKASSKKCLKREQKCAFTCQKEIEDDVRHNTANFERYVGAKYRKGRMFGKYPFAPETDYIYTGERALLSDEFETDPRGDYYGNHIPYENSDEQLASTTDDAASFLQLVRMKHQYTDD